jgi:8-oxo-dGTP diphosphatase
MRFGTKSIIVKGGKILLIKRSSYTEYRKGEWDIPGGRLEQGEGAFKGHKREVLEETGLKIDIIEPVRSWVIDRPKERHVGVTFLSRFLAGEVVLSNEHTEHKWLSPEEILAINAPDWLKKDVMLAVEINPVLFHLRQEF